MFFIANNKTSGILGFRRMRLYSLNLKEKSNKAVPLFPLSKFRRKTLIPCLTWKGREKVTFWQLLQRCGHAQYRAHSRPEERHQHEGALPAVAGRGPGKVIKRDITCSPPSRTCPQVFFANSPFQPKLCKNYKLQEPPGTQTLWGQTNALSWPTNKVTHLLSET